MILCYSETTYWEGGEAFEEMMKPPGPGGAEEAQSRPAFWGASGRGMRHAGPMGLPPPPQVMMNPSSMI